MKAEEYQVIQSVECRALDGLNSLASIDSADGCGRKLGEEVPFSTLDGLDRVHERFADAIHTLIPAHRVGFEMIVTLGSDRVRLTKKRQLWARRVAECIRGKPSP